MTKKPAKSAARKPSELKKILKKDLKLPKKSMGKVVGGVRKFGKDQQD